MHLVNEKVRWPIRCYEMLFFKPLRMTVAASEFDGCCNDNIIQLSAVISD